MKIAVVIRQFVKAGCRPVTSMVISEDPKCPPAQQYVQFQQQAERHRKDFCRRFPEFADAEWYTDIIEMEK